MDAIRNWALTVALSALAGGIVWLMTPKGSVQKAVRTVVAVFLLCAFLSPLFNGRRGLNLEFLPEAEATLPNFDAAVSRQIQAAVETELRARITEVLDRRKISGQIVLATDILPEGSINIATCRVALPPGTDTGGLAAALREAAGLDVEIEVNERKG
ncbi:MAG: hypothetical protein LBG83_00620 [Oscillospiraceae bacterium]|jgi:hypothetical protein|nr:hypothetical protein [Oscillospiraceae bacterium]